jgi:hypothetical protein
VIAERIEAGRQMMGDLLQGREDEERWTREDGGN